jgi:enterochelin esterase-like enzyme
MTCGTEDFLLSMNRDMHTFLTGLGISCDYHEDTGAHMWPFWRDHSAQVIDFHWGVAEK